MTIETVNTSNLGETQVKLARELASKEGEACSSAINTVMKAKEDWQGGPFAVLNALQRDFSADDLARFPRPDSDTGNNPDHFQVTVVENDKKRVKRTTFYAQFADATKEGREILVALDYLKAMKQDNADRSKVPADIKALNPEERKSLEAKLTGRRNTIRQSYKKAMALAYQFEDVNNLGLVEAAPFYKRGTTEVVDSVKCIIVRDRHQAALYELYSIGSFLKINVDKAAEKGGTLEALQETLVRQANSGQGQTSEEQPPIKTVDTLFERLLPVHAFLDEVWSDRKGVKMGELVKKLNSKDALFEIGTLTDIRNVINDILDKVHNAGGRYQEYLAADKDNPANKTGTEG